MRRFTKVLYQKLQKRWWGSAKIHGTFAATYRGIRQLLHYASWSDNPHYTTATDLLYMLCDTTRNHGAIVSLHMHFLLPDQQFGIHCLIHVTHHVDWLVCISTFCKFLHTFIQVQRTKPRNTKLVPFSIPWVFSIPAHLSRSLPCWLSLYFSIFAISILFPFQAPLSSKHPFQMRISVL